MASINKVILIGNLGRDPEVRYTPQGTPVADIGLAVNRVWFDKDRQKREETTFVDVTAWDRQAQTLEKYLRKGAPLYIEGRLQLSSWETKEGEKRSKLRVVLESFEFLDSAASRGGGGGFDEGAAPRRAPAAAPAPAGDEWGAPAANQPVQDDLGLGRSGPEDEVPF